MSKPLEVNDMEWKKLGFGASLVSIIGSIAIYFNHDTELGNFCWTLGVGNTTLER